jgi:predicted transcriptional regulator
MVLRRQFVLDKKSNKLLERLAADRGGNRSRVIREALQRYAEIEARLDAIEEDPGFIAMMERSEADFRAGRLVTHEEVKKQLRAARARRKK